MHVYFFMKYLTTPGEDQTQIRKNNPYSDGYLSKTPKIILCHPVIQMILLYYLNQQVLNVKELYSNFYMIQVYVVPNFHELLLNILKCYLF